MTRLRSFTVRSFATAAVVCLLAISASKAFADQEGGGFGYKATTPDGKHIFVMRDPFNRDTPYPANGMYLNDGSAIPLWTIDWNAFALVPSGGEHLVRLGKSQRWSGSYDEEALTFFSNGRPLKTYTAGELIDLPWLLPHSVSHYSWLLAWRPSKDNSHAELTLDGSRYSNESVTFDERHQTVELLTVLGDRLTFDLKTGEIVLAKRPATVALVAMFAIFLCGYALFRKMYWGTGLDRPWIGPWNVVMGGLFTLALTVIPATAVWFFYISDYPEYESYGYFVRQGFETFPRYVVAFLGFQRPDNTPGGSALVACFWPICLAVFTALDRVTVEAGQRLGRRTVHV